MRVTTKGQVTIPQRIREKLGITPSTEVDFVEKDGGVMLRVLKRQDRERIGRMRGTATIRMTTEQILALTRGVK
jgi:AbrB family looped-hinge helix DNA binding protein